MKVYLSGGMRSDWQDEVRDRCPEIIFIDPRDSGLLDPDQHALWDLRGVDACDILFVCMEEDNPSGYGLSLEVGYAKALGKKVIFVDEQNCRYMAIVRSAADVVVNNLDAGLNLLCQLTPLYE